MTVSRNHPTGGAAGPAGPAGATGAAGAAGPAGVGGLGIDADVTIPTEDERHKDVIRLKHFTDFSFLATDYDFLSAQPTSWSIRNSGVVTSCTANPTADPGTLEFVANGSANFWSGTHTAFQAALALLNGWKPGDELIFRVQCELNTATNEEAIQVGICNAAMSAPTTFPTNNGAYWDCGYTSSTHKLRAKADGSATSITSGVTEGVNSAGVWVKIRHEGQFTSWWYDLTDSAVDPDRGARPWTVVARNSQAVPADAGAPAEVLVIAQSHSNASANQTGRLMYFEYRAADPEGSPYPNCGCDSSNPEIQLITDADIGASATLSDADLQAALAEIANPRRFDSGTWTFSAQRSASTGATSGTYAAAASATVEGTGRYFSLFAKCNSNGAQQGSLRDGLNIRVT